MIESMLASGVFKLILLAVGVIVGRIGLYWFDASMNKIDRKDNAFSKVWEKASEDAKLDYYKWRIAAVFLAVAIILS